jgi:hypothetical protein
LDEVALLLSNFLNFGGNNICVSELMLVKEDQSIQIAKAGFFDGLQYLH